MKPPGKMITQPTQPAHCLPPYALPQRLCHSAMSGDLSAMADLLAQGADPKAAWLGSTPLILASAYRRIECASVLLPLSDVFARDHYGLNALDVAARAGSVRILDLLLPCYGNHLDAMRGAADGSRPKRPDIASRIDAYALALSEKMDLESISHAPARASRPARI